MFAAGCIDRMILQCVCIVFVHLSPSRCLLPGAFGELFGSRMLSFLSILKLSLGVFSWVPNHFAVGALAFAPGVSSWICWQHDFPICVFSFSFTDYPNVFCGCLGRVILHYLFLHFLAAWLHGCISFFCLHHD